MLFVFWHYFRVCSTLVLFYVFFINNYILNISFIHKVTTTDRYNGMNTIHQWLITMSVVYIDSYHIKSSSIRPASPNVRIHHCCNNPFYKGIITTMIYSIDIVHFHRCNIIVLIRKSSLLTNDR